MSRVLIFVNNKKISDMLHGRIDEDFEDQFEFTLTSHKITV
jgi:ATP-dependent RNA helicase RhlE